MKVKIEELNLETTLEDVCLSFELEEEEVLEGLSNNQEYFEGPAGDGVTFYKIDKDVLEMEFNFERGFWEETMYHINHLKVVKDNQFMLIIKDSWYGEDEGEDVGYTSFEALNNRECEPDSLKGGEYEEKFFMTDKEEEHYYHLRNEELIDRDSKYQEFYIEKVENFDSDKWIKEWITTGRGSYIQSTGW
jgi:hypothetical protein|tara:strand:+ start:755 stop:1324 length:570 start_codon:yes stop_codon:yes gene_type:complete